MSCQGKLTEGRGVEQILQRESFGGKEGNEEFAGEKRWLAEERVRERESRESEEVIDFEQSDTPTLFNHILPRTV